MSDTSKAPDTATVTIKNSESFYYSNGDLVLLSLPKDNIITAFKVDRVLLLRASPVFEGMLALPTFGIVESHDNVPLVNLQDEADHITMFLKALYDSRCLPWRKHNFDTVRTVEGILLLANKYQVDHLRERIIDLLERDWPSKLSEWDTSEIEISARLKGQADENCTIYEDPIPEPCEAIRLARKCDVPSILPAAFYHLSRIRGISDRRLPSSFLDNFYGDPEPGGGRFADFSLLSAEDLRCLIVGRDAISQVFQDYLRDALGKALIYKHSSSTAKCAQGVHKLRSQLELRVLYHCDDPLSLMKKNTNALNITPDIYAVCASVFLHSLRSKRENFWNRLPDLFLLKLKQ